MPKNILSIRGMLDTAVSSANFLGPALYKGLKTASIKFTLINVPAYLLFFASNNQPEGQEDKIIEASKGAAAMHIIQAAGFEIAKEFPAIKGLEASSNILGCVVQAAITGKTLVAGFIRGASYQMLGMNYYSILLTEGLYSGSNVLTSYSNSGFSETLDTSIKAAYAGAGVANYLYAVVQCIFLPVVMYTPPDAGGAILLYHLSADFNHSKAIDISNAIVNKLLPVENSYESMSVNEALFSKEGMLSGECPTGGFYDNQTN